MRTFVGSYTGDCSVVTVSPVGGMGKALSRREDSASMGMQHLLRSKIAPDDFFQLLYFGGQSNPYVYAHGQPQAVGNQL